MPYAVNQGVRIHYEVEGEGSPLILIHPGAHSIEDMRDHGWVDGLKDSYRLILVDMRGHGRSGKPHDVAAYQLEALAGDVTAVLDQVSVSKAHCFGYSGFGYVGFALARAAPHRLISLIVGGMSPYGFRRPEDQTFLAARVEAFRKGMAAYVAAMEAQGLVYDPRIKVRRLASDGAAFAACFQAARDWPNLEAALPTMTMPCLIYSGDRDSLANPGAEECVKHMPNARFISFPGLDHLTAVSRVDLVLPSVKKFLAEVTKAERRVPKATEAA